MANRIFTCWAELRDGALRHLQFTATDCEDARRMTFAACPGAVSVSCRASCAIEEDRRHV